MQPRSAGWSGPKGGGRKRAPRSAERGPEGRLIERFFAYISTDLLQRSDHRSVQALEADIRAWIDAWNDDPKPFVWTKTAEQILDKL